MSFSGALAELFALAPLLETFDVNDNQRDQKMM